MKHTTMQKKIRRNKTQANSLKENKRRVKKTSLKTPSYLGCLPSSAWFNVFSQTKMLVKSNQEV
jgi:hypothetical protein